MVTPVFSCSWAARIIICLERAVSGRRKTFAICKAIDYPGTVNNIGN